MSSSEKSKTSESSSSSVSMMSRPLSATSLQKSQHQHQQKRTHSSAAYRSATAFELHAQNASHNHHNHRIYPTFSSGYAIRQKFYPHITESASNQKHLTNRPRSSMNLTRRSYTTALVQRAASRARVYGPSSSSPDNDKHDDDEDEDAMPKRSVFTLIRLAALYFGIEVLFSLETALAIPILLKLKVPEK